MIKISYEPDKHDTVYGNGKCEICFDGESVLTEVMYGFIKVCEFAGYSVESFDRIVKGMEDGESFKDYIIDCLDALIY